MEIFRRVYCEQKYEGVYQLKFKEKYRWVYVIETMTENEDEFDYPKLNLGSDRNLTQTPVAYMLNLTIEFKEEDLEQSYETIKTIKD